MRASYPAACLYLSWACTISSTCQVIELARVMREKHRLPTKTPLKSMMVVHSDAAFLADIGGDLLPYVLEETNVRELQVPPRPQPF
jgi:isoleucyl-tRNA synthetase